MPTLVLDPPPPELTALIAKRRELDLDRFDEVWEGVLHMNPAPHGRHARLQTQLIKLLGPLAETASLTDLYGFNLGESDDYRIPDAGLLRPGPDQLYYPTAALVVEIVSPGDKTYEKLPFYAARHVEEVLIVDPLARTVEWLGLAGGGYEAIDASRLINLGPAELAERIDWPE